MISQPPATIGLRCQDVCKAYRDAGTITKVLDGASLDARAGKLTFIVGPSGCGKSTMLAIIAGLMGADSGSVDVLGTRLGDLSDSARTRLRSRHIGIVLQQFQLFPALTVAENIAVPLLVLNQSHRAADAAALSAAERVGLGEHARKYPRELSVGQKQRTAIARATVHAPGLLLCDEPTAALDRATADMTMTLLRRYAVDHAATVVIVTHDPHLIRHDDAVWSIADGALCQAPTATNATTRDEVAPCA